MNSKKLFVLCLTSLTLTGLVGCGGNNASTTNSKVQESSSESISSPYTIKITAIGSTDIKVSKTVQLRTSVTGTTQKDVTWTSLNPSIASVTDRGLVTGLSEGKAIIKATLNLDPNCTTTIEVNVEGAAAPTDITISNYVDSTAWVGEKAELSVVASPEEAIATVKWTSSDSQVATVSETGVVEFLKEGNVNISATSTVDSSISDNVDYVVKYGLFTSNTGSSNFDISHQADKTNPYIKIDDSNDDLSGGFNTKYFAHVKATKFYVEMSFQGSKLTKNMWDWQGIGLGAGLNDNDSRFFTFSPHNPNMTANNFNKVILRERPESWGALTNRSQIWGENGLDNIDYTKINKMAMLRNENEYYYLINDKVYYYDLTEKYNNIPTIPFVVCYDMPAKFANFKVVTADADIDAILNKSMYKDSFYPAYSNTTYFSDSQFSFNDINGYSKGQRIKSVGDKAKLYKNFKVEFDVDSMVFNSTRSCFTGLTINLSRYDAADEVETISLGVSSVQNNDRAIIGRYSKWDFTQAFESPSAIKNWSETTETVKTDAAAKSHVIITREVQGDFSYYHLYVDGKEYKFTLSNTGACDGVKVPYTGAYLMWVAGEYSTCNVTNFVFSSDVTL